MVKDIPIPKPASRWSEIYHVWRTTSSGSRVPKDARLPTSIRLLTWNVDFSSPKPSSRLYALLYYLKHDIFRCPNDERPKPCVIMLQEVHREALEIILGDPWVREWFVVSPTSADGDGWADGAVCGNVTLVARTVPVVGVHTIQFSNSVMGRGALFVDLKLSVPPGTRAARAVFVRVGNTHLESLGDVSILRRQTQMEMVARFLKENQLHCGVVGGDMNALDSMDEGLARKNGLRDAWTGGSSSSKGKGREGVLEAGEEDGMTWGYQSPGTEYPPRRLDRVYHTPPQRGREFTVEEPKRVGVGLALPSGEFVTDHYGLLTKLQVLPG